MDRQFKDRIESGHIPDLIALNIECLRFGLIELIQGKLDQTSIECNQHQVRGMNNCSCPSGKLDLMYFTPELYGAQDYKFPVTKGDVIATAEYLATDATRE